VTLGFHSHNFEPFPITGNFVLLGVPKTGKSETLFRIALDLIHENKSILFLGKIEEIFNYIPTRRLKDVILIDPARAPFALNILAGLPKDQHPQFASILTQALTKQNITPLREYFYKTYFRLAVQTLLTVPHSTLLDIKRLLTDTKYRHGVLKTMTDSFIKDMWNDFDALKDPLLNIESTLSVLYDMMLEPNVRECIGQVKNKLVLKDKIVLVDLKDMGTDNMSLMGSLILSRVLVEDADTTVMIDDAEHFPYEPLFALKHTRTICTLQSLKGLDSVPVVAFRVSRRDAKHLDFPLYSGTPMYELPDFRAYAMAGAKVAELYMPMHEYPKQKPRRITALRKRCRSQFSARPEVLKERMGRMFNG